MGPFIWIIVIGGLIWAVAQGVKLRKQQEAEDATFVGAHAGWDIYKSAYDRGILALDHDGRRIAVGTVTSHIERPWSDISAVEIERNGQSMTQTNRGSQVMGAAVGAVLLGPLGLLMGGLSGSKRQKERVNELALKIIVDDRTMPLHRVVFFRMKGNGADARSKLLTGPAGKLEHFHALISNAIRQDNRAFASAAAQPTIAGGGNADAIARLWELKQQGALTEAEFNAEKDAILAAPRLSSS